MRFFNVKITEAQKGAHETRVTNACTTRIDEEKEHQKYSTVEWCRQIQSRCASTQHTGHTHTQDRVKLKIRFLKKI